ncbi:hypothetical protein [Silvibacterium acidisoli]|uniref:hypothetical protein n=1 Tax=Acidobacteriaceae bacterium ZG23-2 TaxID=2883246 RepID=UPI00406C3A1E
MIQRANGPVPGIEPLMLPKYARGREEAGEAFSVSGSGDAKNVTIAEANIRNHSSHLFSEASHGLRIHTAESDVEKSSKSTGLLPKDNIAQQTSGKPQSRPDAPVIASARKELPAEKKKEQPGDEVAVKPTGRDEKSGRQEATSREVFLKRIEASPDTTTRRTEAVSSSPKQALRKEVVRADVSIQARPVTISIGHIEVRATQQPAVSPRKPAFQPGVSLAHFLKREGGARS